MKELIRWLKKIEHNVGEIYSQAVDLCDNDPGLKEFLQRLAEDEAWHYHVMASAEEHLSDSAPRSAVSVDRETNNRIKRYQDALIAHIRNKHIDKETFVEKFVELELSEWNDIFIHVVNYLKKTYKEFIYPAVRIQSHLKEIELFLEKMPGGEEKLKKLKQVPIVWKEKILIVDDEEIITQVLKAILNREGDVQVASNGQEALSMIKQSYYKLIVSDMDMPVMDGPSLYIKAVDQYPSLKSRFLFMSGFFSETKLQFVQGNQLPYMEKPMEIDAFRQKCLEILMMR
jgi:CheY-like chemotaxis protein